MNDVKAKVQIQQKLKLIIKSRQSLGHSLVTINKKCCQM